MINKTCTISHKEFTITPDQQALYTKLEMPEPTMCSDCIHQQHLAFWVWGKFRKGTSDLDGSNLITVMPQSSRFPLYHAKQWFGDDWDAMDYGQEYDETKPFFEQFKALQEKVPHPHQVGKNNVDCDWSDDAWDCKNCYLSRSLADCEDCSFVLRVLSGKNAFDVTYGIKVDSSYDCTYVFDVFKLRHSLNCYQSTTSAFLYDCRNVQDSFMCWNVRNKQYCWFNEQLTKEQYKEKLAQINLGSWDVVQNYKKEFERILRDQAVHKENMNLRATDSTGNYINDCNNCKNCFYWETSENCHNCMRGLESKDLIDITGNWKMELAGNNAHSVEGYFMKYSLWCGNCRYLEYCDQCIDCSYCFGCVGLKKKQYCILNKQYSKEEYEALKEKIVASMKADGTYGQFLPLYLAYGGYNMSWGQVYYPSDKATIEAQGGLWEDAPESQVEGMVTDQLPDDIKDVEDTITTQPLVCPESGFRFNISPRELTFYRHMNIPLPRVHFDKRMLGRFKKVSVMKAYPYKCTYCAKDIMAYYPPQWGYKKIACVECYQQHVN